MCSSSKPIVSWKDQWFKLLIWFDLFGKILKIPKSASSANPSWLQDYNNYNFGCLRVWTKVKQGGPPFPIAHALRFRSVAVKKVC